MRMKFFSRNFCFFLFCTLFIVPQSSEAQTYMTFQNELDSIVERTKVRIGPFRIIPQIGFQFLRYEWNIFYQREDEDPAFDFASTISPELNVYLVFKNRLLLRLADRLSYVHYYKHKDERRLNNSFTPELKLLLLNRFVLSGSYTNIRERGRPTSEFNIRANEYRRSFRGNLFYETPRQTSIGISFSQTKYLYDDITFPGQEAVLSRILNRKDEDIRIEFNYHVLSDSFFFISVNYTNHDFEYTEEFDRRSNSLQALTGLRFPLVGGITGTLALGYKRIKPKAQGLEGKAGLIGNTQLIFRGGRFGARISYNRGFPFSLWDNNVFYIDNRYLLGASVYVTDFLRLDYDFSLGRSNYPELIPLYYPDGSFENIKRVDNYYTHTLRLVVRLFEEIGLGISANQWSRDSNYLGESRSQIYFDATMTFSF